MCACHVLKDKWHLAGSAAFNLFHCSFLILKMVTRTIIFNFLVLHISGIFFCLLFFCSRPVSFCLLSQTDFCCILIFSAVWSSQCLILPGFFQNPLHIGLKKYIYSACTITSLAFCPENSFSTLADKKDFRSLNLGDLSKKPYSHKQVLHISELLTLSL